MTFLKKNKNVIVNDIYNTYFNFFRQKDELIIYMEMKHLLTS